MSENRPFGFDPEDLDRAAREVGEGIRDALGRLGNLLGEAGVGTVWSTGIGPNVHTASHPRRRPTTADAGDGVWAIVVVDDTGTATVEQVYACELDALRANGSNVDPRRRVRFLPYGIAVSALDADRDIRDAEAGEADTGEPGAGKPDDRG